VTLVEDAPQELDELVISRKEALRRLLFKLTWYSVMAALSCPMVVVMVVVTIAH
jgi:hypothetical protein